MVSSWPDPQTSVGPPLSPQLKHTTTRSEAAKNLEIHIKDYKESLQNVGLVFFFHLTAKPSQSREDT